MWCHSDVVVLVCSRLIKPFARSGKNLKQNCKFGEDDDNDCSHDLPLQVLIVVIGNGKSNDSLQKNKQRKYGSGNVGNGI
jgi:hypothetical protein